MADVEKPTPGAPIEVPSASTTPVRITEPVTTTTTDADGDVSINEGEDTPEAQAFAQGGHCFISSSLHTC